jgi:hypothetical protein
MNSKCVYHMGMLGGGGEGHGNATAQATGDGVGDVALIKVQSGLGWSQEIVAAQEIITAAGVTKLSQFKVVSPIVIGRRRTTPKATLVSPSALV